MATPRLDKLVLRAADGGPLHVDIRSGARAGESRPAVAICHGFKGFKDWGMFPRLAERLARAGFVAATFNFSGSGVSDGDVFDEPDRWFHQKPSLDLEDVRTVLDHLEGMGAGPLGLVGHSRGGALAIVHTARDPRVRALVSWAAVDHFLRWPVEVVAQWRETGTVDVVNSRTGQVLPIGRDALDDWDTHHRGLLSVEAAASRVAVPWLVAHGSNDETVPVSVAHDLMRWAAPGRAEVVIIEGGNHTFGARHPWVGATEHLDTVFARTTAFLAEHLR